MLNFDATIHARPERVAPDRQLVLNERTVTTLALAGTDLYTPYPITFEMAEAALGAIEGLFCEPDGSFVWGRGVTPHRWQIDGHLFDRNERLLYVAIKGSAPEPEFDRLLAALGWPATPLVFQLQRHSVVLDEAEFRRFASAV